MILCDVYYMHTHKVSVKCNIILVRAAARAQCQPQKISFHGPNWSWSYPTCKAKAAQKLCNKLLAPKPYPNRINSIDSIAVVSVLHHQVAPACLALMGQRPLFLRAVELLFPVMHLVRLSTLHI